METEEPTMDEAPVKEGLGIAVGPEEYIPVSPRYVRDGEKDADDQDKDEDVEAPFLAPKDDLTSRTPQDVQAALPSLKGNAATVKDPKVSSSDESIPEVIDLAKEEDAPPSLPPKRVKHPTTLGLGEKMETTAEGSPIPPPHFSKGKAGKRTTPVAAPEVNIEAEVPKEQIIYINDDADPIPTWPS